MAKMFILLILLSLIINPLSASAWDDYDDPGWNNYNDPMKPGGYLNPYKIERDPYTGELEMKSKYPFQDPMKPGQYLNPYQIKPDPYGEGWEMKPKYPFNN